jgi:acetoin utilization protein AcuB
MSTAVVSVAPDQPLPEAAALMVERKFGALPVIEDGRLVGILTSTDLLEQCMNTLWRPEAFAQD